MSDFMCHACGEATSLACLTDLGCSCLLCRTCAVGALEQQLHAYSANRCPPHAAAQPCKQRCSPTCPVCSAPVTLLRQLVPEALQRAEDAAMGAWIIQHSSIIRCPHPGCGAVIERLPAGSSSAAGQDGLSAEAHAHMQAHRFRCPLCSHNFCDACLAIPYHQGCTCEQHAAPNCPYCDAKVLPQPGNSSNTSNNNSNSSSSNRRWRWPFGRRAAGGQVHGHLTARELRVAVQAAGADASWCLERGELEALHARVQQVCSDKDCREKLSQACTRQLACGHWCCGLRGEAACPPCLQPECLQRSKAAGPLSTAGVCCALDCCFCFEPLPSAPCITLTCSHACHASCARAQLLASYPGPDVSFGFLFCPLCGDGSGAGRAGNVQQATAAPHLQHAALEAQLRRPLELRDQVVTLAKQRLRAEGLAKTEPQLQPGGKFDGRPADYALRKFLFFECSRCRRPYFGGARACGDAGVQAGAGGARHDRRGAVDLRGQPGVQANGGFDGRSDRSELLCGECSALACGSSCPLHGSRYTEWKCRHCCNIATYFCFGSTHMCARCHDNPIRGMVTPPCDPTTCALPPGMPHPPAGEECCLGCGLCRRTAADHVHAS